MKLDALMNPWLSEPLKDIEIMGLQNDSRKVKPGDLFLAYPGAQADGRLFISNAVSSGAVAIAYDPQGFSGQIPDTVAKIAIENLSNKIAEIACHFYDKPSSKLKITGITGTNGKTTIAYLLAQAYDLLEKPAAYIGTLGEGKTSDIKPLGNTTPDALSLQRIFSSYVDQGIQQVCMEVSSHALEQGRVLGVAFDQAIYTNLSHEHLDYHQTMDAYSHAKAKLFGFTTLQSAIVNADDKYGDFMSKNLPKHTKKITYGLKRGEIKATHCKLGMAGSDFTIETPAGNFETHIQLLGSFNIYNCLALFASLLADGYTPDIIVTLMAQLKASPGRMETILTSPVTLVDYAHTPDALENALLTLNALKKARLIVVFGCGGDRDKSKRPLMGKIANKYADIVIVTSDNPRTEEPQNIMRDIVQGIGNDKDVITIESREKAIEYALNLATQEDIILVAGKGHENYQEIGNKRYHFSDQEIIRELNSKQKRM